ncbi:casein kinase II regulatory subunit-domain-containing protein [Neohortaea acidophila]|uniref:Casein kinase II subunit beta n=1 Tax=Neohortaea acidophila TaxID=245834 RepID=A0A6A6Q313_9PEZI|nr:casein kinase II regulatory subunit-domain-containing protein [Neohortaea acidophila]KAF2486790.1 casein kinase II regulatory subunit-domain-containing protein [Neohortaea acidophila]
MSSSSQAPESWISAFCSLVGHEYFAEVSEDFIEDDFNLTGLQSQVPMYKEALEMILDVEPEDTSEGDEEEEEEEEDEDEDEDEMQDGAGRGYRRGQSAADRRHMRMASDFSVIESSAEMLYGLIHQRFITSRQGIQQMAEKYDLGHFGQCPRVYCHGAKVLPVGCSDIPGQETVKLFCPSCLDVYSPPNSRFQTVDGAFFGTTFGCLFFMTFPDLDVAGTKPPTNGSNTQQSDPTPASTSTPPGSMNHTTNLDRVNPRSSIASSLTSPPATFSSNNNNNNASSQPQQPAQQTTPLPPQPDSINGIITRNLAPGLGGVNSIYEPRIYGFRVAEVSKTGPRMKWLRSRPADINELDEGKLWALNQETGMEVDGEEEDADQEMDVEHQGQQQQQQQQQEATRDAFELRGGGGGVKRENHDVETASSQVREVEKRKKASRRRSSRSTGGAQAAAAAHDGAALLNGSGGTALGVGEAG